MNEAKAQVGRAKVVAIVYDKHGRPKVDQDKFNEFAPYLSDDEKAYLIEQYLKDEVKHGNNAS